MIKVLFVCRGKNVLFQKNPVNTRVVEEKKKIFNTGIIHFLRFWVVTWRENLKGKSKVRKLLWDCPLCLVNCGYMDFFFDFHKRLSIKAVNGEKRRYDIFSVGKISWYF